jgi:hypothetical protein
MARVPALILFLLCSACLTAQSFDCAPIGPLPTNPALSCEGVCGNATNVLNGIRATPACGFPTSGANYLDLRSSGPPVGPYFVIPVGGPFPRPAAPQASEARIPIPTGATTLSFSWEFFNGETANSTLYNDGMSVDIVSATGTLVANLAYADTWSGTMTGTGGCVSNGTETTPAGPQSFLAALPPYSACDYVSIVVWNSGDNVAPSKALFDSFVFDSTLAGCPVPCITSSTVPTLTFSSPFGFGSIQADMGNLPPFGNYFFAVTFYAGAYPNGWLYGLDIPLSELSFLINFGYPFFGPADGCGSATIGPAAGLPSGLQLYAMTFALPQASPSPSAHSAATTYVIP